MNPETQYLPEMWLVKKDSIYAAIRAIEAGLDYARENLSEHDARLGRTTRKNLHYAKLMETDIAHMERTVVELRAYSASTMPQ